jgi:UDP-2,3-diacylglucosamine pyrophosphatase LpxH
MGHDRALTKQKLSELWQRKDIPVLDISGNKYAMFSDIHFGNGGRADDVRFNKEALMRAFDHYNREGYSLIFLGDIEELWQFKLHEIEGEYNNSVYAKIRAFEDENVHRVFGNHDIDWRMPCDPAKTNPVEYLCATEALKLKDEHGNIVALLVHGHQGDDKSDKIAWLSRRVVRAYRWIEGFIKVDRAKPATKSKIEKDFEQILYSWAKEYQVILICGHSHRAIFASKAYAQRLEEEISKLKEQIRAAGDDEQAAQKLRFKLEEKERDLKREKKYKRHIEPIDPEGDPLPCFFNTGCALYPGGAIAIEIADNTVKLVKWHKEPKGGSPFKVYHEADLKEVISKVTGKG